MLVAALALSPLAFVFGGFAALLALPGVFLARLRAPAFVYFGGALICALLSLAGVNPWASYVRERVLDDLEAALGARPTYAAWDFNAGTGDMRLENLEVKLPALNGSAELVQARISAGPGFVWNSARPRVEGRGLRVSVDGNSDFASFLGGLKGKTTRAIELDFESIELVVTGSDLEASIAISAARGVADESGFRVEVAPKQMDLDLWGQTHRLGLMGKVAFERREDVTAVSLDLRGADGDALGFYAHGTLHSQPGPGGLVVTLDHADLGQLWARYRKIDVYGGSARGTARISGSLAEFVLALDVEISGYRYFHRAVMALDESRAFDVPQARLVGGLRVRGGKTFVLEDLALEVPKGTLCTDPAMNARGGALLVLNGEYPKLRGRLEARVISGRLAQAISWNPVSTRALMDVQPNVIQVAEQFSDLTLDYTVEVAELALACEPISGKLSGTLTGTLQKEPGSRQGRLSVGGKLQIAEGKFAFCAASGDLTGTIEFNPNAPSYEAAIRGELKGKVATTDLNAEVTGRLSHPGLIFKGVTMHPDELGRLIATHGDQDAAEKARRSEALSRLCGPAAAMNNNPFLAHKAGRVSFTFKP